MPYRAPIGPVLGLIAQGSWPRRRRLARPRCPKTGPIGGPIGQKNLGEFFVFSYIFKVFYGIFGVYIFPKWLKKVPGHIPILFGWFWELPKSWLFLDLLLVISGPVDLVFVCFYGVSIIPEWRIKVPGPIAILFRRFLDLRTSWFLWTRSGPLHLLFIIKILQKYKKIWNHP